MNQPTNEDILKAFGRQEEAFKEHDKADQKVAEVANKRLLSLETNVKAFAESHEKIGGKLDQIIERVTENEKSRAVQHEKDKAVLEKLDSVVSSFKNLAEELKKEYATREYVDQKDIATTKYVDQKFDAITKDGKYKAIVFALLGIILATVVLAALPQ